MSYQERNTCLVQRIVGHTAQQPLAQPKMAVSAHGDEVSVERSGYVGDSRQPNFVGNAAKTSYP
jgi:hypothetical protein